MKMINEFISRGYKYLFVKEGARTRFWVSKDDEITKDSPFDEYAVEDDYEKAVLKAIEKNKLYRLVGE